MSYRAILVASLLATLSLASPMARQTSACVPDDASRFTLVSISKADSTIQNLTLVLNGLPDSSVAFIGSAESIDSIVVENFDLVNGGITAYDPDGSPAFVSNYVAYEDGLLSFFSDSGIPPAQVYCESDVGIATTLAVNGGDGDNFSLCKNPSSNDFVVVYKAVAGISGIDLTTCDAVDVVVVRVDE